jgi:pilus assembly protein CpaF
MSLELLDKVRRQLAAQSRPGGRDSTTAEIVRALRASGTAPPDQTSLLRLSEALSGDLIGAGPLQPLLDDPAVTDVVVNGPNGVWADRGEGLRPTDVRLGRADAVRALACRLAAAAGRRLDAGSPYADVRLPDGTRFHAVLPPIATAGPYLSFRTHRSKAFTLTQLVEADTLTADMADLLLRMVKAKLPFLVTGGTGSGKTTLLATLLSHAPQEERIVVVEDAAELALDHPHALTLESRPANVEGAGAVDLAALVRQALRIRWTCSALPRSSAFYLRKQRGGRGGLLLRSLRFRNALGPAPYLRQQTAPAHRTEAVKSWGSSSLWRGREAR